jgi:hypothetical protein
MPALFERLLDNADSSYANIRAVDSEEARACKAFADSLWTHFQPYTDDGFVEDFPV